MTAKQHIARIVQPDRDNGHIDSGDEHTARINPNTRIAEIISPTMDDDIETNND